MWTAQSAELPGGRGLRLTIALNSRPASFAEVIQAWQNDGSFRSLFNSLLAGAAYSAFRWETPPVTRATSGRAFEFVLLDSPGLERPPTPEEFAEHFAGTSASDVVTFPNLGGDAVLVVPRPLAAPVAYGHLGAFVRNAPEAQRLALWQAVGDAMSARLATSPVWLSTAGGGVSWLHVRLDDRPKYYGFAPFRTQS